MRLVDLVRIDHRFEKSVNLLLDLNDESKLKLYIPTRSSIKLLTEYLEEVDTFSGKRANILIGPYRKSIQEEKTVSSHHKYKQWESLSGLCEKFEPGIKTRRFHGCCAG